MQIPLFQAKIQELLPSLHSRVRFSTLQLPLAVVTATNRPASAVSADNPHGQEINGPAAAVVRLYTEETASGEDHSWFCMHLVVISTLRQPQTLTYKLSALPAPTRGRTITARAIFDEDYTMGLDVSASGEAVFSDAIESFGQKFYRLGCARPAVNASNAVVDPSFEGCEYTRNLLVLAICGYILTETACGYRHAPGWSFSRAQHGRVSWPMDCQLPEAQHSQRHVSVL
jgi:hypothetical protein